MSAIEQSLQNAKRSIAQMRLIVAKLTNEEVLQKALSLLSDTETMVDEMSSGKIPVKKTSVNVSQIDKKKIRSLRSDHKKKHKMKLRNADNLEGQYLLENIRRRDSHFYVLDDEDKKIKRNKTKVFKTKRKEISGTSDSDM